jgi:hypothetical protein
MQITKMQKKCSKKFVNKCLIEIAQYFNLGGIMKCGIRYLHLIYLLVSIPLSSSSQSSQTYKHPSLNFQYEALEDWINIPHPEDSLIYEMTSPDSGIHVMLWYTETEQSAEKYLLKMVSMKDLDMAGGVANPRSINDLDMWVITLPGYEGKVPVRLMIGITARGKSKKHPKENRLFIIQIWCHQDKYSSYETIFEEILKTVKIGL